MENLRWKSQQKQKELYISIYIKPVNDGSGRLMIGGGIIIVIECIDSERVVSKCDVD